MTCLLGSVTCPLHTSANHRACISDIVNTPPEAGCTKPINARPLPMSGLNTFLYNCKNMAHTNEPYYIFIWYKKSGSLCIFLQYHCRLANLYIFRKVITREVREDGRFWIFKMANIKYIFGRISASDHPKNYFLNMIILCFEGQGIFWKYKISVMENS